MLRACLLIVTVILLSGCAAHSYVALPEQGSVTVKREGQQHSLTEAGTSLALGAVLRQSTFSAEHLQRVFAGALAARPPEPQRFVVYLEADGRPNSLSEQVLDQVLHAASEREYPVVVVTGHTDSLGYKAVNLQVGLLRARDMARRLEARGLQAVVQIESLGELDLLVKTPDATPQVRNRRVEIEVR